MWAEAVRLGLLLLESVSSPTGRMYSSIFNEPCTQSLNIFNHFKLGLESVTANKLAKLTNCNIHFYTLFHLFWHLLFHFLGKISQN